MTEKQLHPTWELEILEGKSALILTACPGTKGVDLTSSLQQLKAQGAQAVMTALTVAEMKKAQVSELPQKVQALGMLWVHLPIEDNDVPSDTFMSSWNTNEAKLKEIVAKGGKIAIHCMGGSGRTGLLAAHLLLDLGWDLDKIKKEVQLLRPTAFTKAKQLAYINKFATE